MSNVSHFKFGLRSSKDNVVINGTGGTCYVAQAGSSQKQALLTASGAAASNPFTLTNGVSEFWASGVTAVDIYLQTPAGHWLVQKGVAPSGLNEYSIDTDMREVFAVIPFAIQDTAAATETTTGFSLPTNAIVQPLGGNVEFITADVTGKSIQVGILSSQTNGNASGFFNAISSYDGGATVPFSEVPAFSQTSGTLNGNTFGAFLANYGAGAPGTGYAFLQQYRCDGVAKTISYTLSSGTTLAQGFITIPYVLPPV